ncbi:MAG: NAD(P)/FAD-dependent oxidoreductase [candidate division WOR-3 bacterium]|nr:MAG: NAD(P)/FAD-dependent oxidoreductase [candidate division WOR-3 bacterium]
MPTEYDVIVIGAGPAGSAAAAAASEKGLSVLLIEEHSQIGTPLACAEGLSRSTIKGWLEIEPEWIAQSLSGAIIRDPRGNEFTIEYPNVGWVLNRKVFDPALADLAAQRGAVVKKSTKAVGIEGNEIITFEASTNMKQRFKFKYVIGADGITSKVGRWMGIDTKLHLGDIEVCAQYRLGNVDKEPRYAHLILDSKIAPGGYAWIFPKSNSSANVGLGLSPSRTKNKPKHLLDRWVEREFRHARVEERIYGGVPARVPERFSGKNFCLVGDAARFTDPLSGAGIANAIKSGIIAGRNAASIVKGRKNSLQNEMKKEIIDEIKWHYRVRNIYKKLTDRDFEEGCKLGTKLFRNKTVSDINTHLLVRQLLLLSPQLLKLGFRLLF